MEPHWPASSFVHDGALNEREGGPEYGREGVAGKLQRGVWIRQGTIKTIAKQQEQARCDTSESEHSVQQKAPTKDRVAKVPDIGERADGASDGVTSGGASARRTRMACARVARVRTPPQIPIRLG